MFPGRTATFASWNDQIIQQAPLADTELCVDRAKVLQVLPSLTSGLLSAAWVSGLMRYRDGHMSMKALHDYFPVEGSATRCIEKANQLKTSLHYRNEG